jgi:hypothetical protein
MREENTSESPTRIGTEMKRRRLLLNDVQKIGSRKAFWYATRPVQVLLLETLSLRRKR